MNNLHQYNEWYILSHEIKLSWPKPVSSSEHLLSKCSIKLLDNYCFLYSEDGLKQDGTILRRSGPFFPWYVKLHRPSENKPSLKAGFREA